MAVSRFVGVGVGVYDKGHPRLEHAVPDVEAVAGLLEELLRLRGLARSR